MKERAKRNRRSLNQEVIAELAGEAGIGGEERMRELAGRVEAFRAKLPRFLNSVEIREAIAEGRK